MGGEDDRENVEKMPRIKTPSIIAGIQPEAALELIWCDAKKLQLHSQPKKKTLDKESRMGNLKRYLTNQFKYKKGTL